MFTHWHLVSFGWSILYLGWCICICIQTSRPASCLLYSPILPCSCLVEPHLASKLCFPPDIWFLSHQYFYFRLWVPSFALLKVIFRCHSYQMNPNVSHGCCTCDKYHTNNKTTFVCPKHRNSKSTLPETSKPVDFVTQNLLAFKPKIYLAQNSQAQNLLCLPDLRSASESWGAVLPRESEMFGSNSLKLKHGWC